VDCPNCGWNTVELRSNGIPSNNPIVPFDKGTPCPVCSGRGRLTARVDWQHGHYLVEGFGVPPRDMLREYVETRSPKLLRTMRLKAMRAAQVDCYRNVVALAARVRLDGDRLMGDMARELKGHVEMFEEVGDGEWVDQNVSIPFFKMMMKVPLWGAEGVVAVFYKSQSQRVRKTKKKPFDWRKALDDYKENPRKYDPPGKPTEKPAEDPTPGETPGEKPEPTPGETPGETPEPTPGETPGETPEPTPGETPGETPEPTPGETPGETPEPTPGETPGEKPEPTPGETPEPGEVEPEPVEPTEEEPSEYDEIIIDARTPAEGGAAPNPALFPQVQFEDEKGDTHAVYDLSEVEEETVSEAGMVEYVNSNTPFEKISMLAGPKTLVLRATALRGQVIRVAGLNLPIFFQEGVDFGGKKGAKKKKFQYKFRAVKTSGLQKANIVISAKDALELKKTDEAAKVLKKCKVIIISGGDIAGKKGQRSLDRKLARK
jgi:hypothetical protein